MKTRRDFIKISALGVGATAITAGGAKAVLGSSLFGNENGNETETLRRVPTYCEVCFWKCAGWAHVTKDGNIKMYNTQYQIDTVFFRILINSTFKIYMSEYEGITINYNYSK